MDKTNNDVMEAKDRASATARKLRTLSDTLAQCGCNVELSAEGTDGLAYIVMEAESVIVDLLSALRSQGVPVAYEVRTDDGGVGVEVAGTVWRGHDKAEAEAVLEAAFSGEPWQG